MDKLCTLRISSNLNYILFLGKRIMCLKQIILKIPLECPLNESYLATHNDQPRTILVLAKILLSSDFSQKIWYDKLKYQIATKELRDNGK